MASRHCISSVCLFIIYETLTISAIIRMIDRTDNAVDKNLKLMPEKAIFSVFLIFFSTNKMLLLAV